MYRFECGNNNEKCSHLQLWRAGIKKGRGYATGLLGFLPLYQAAATLRSGSKVMGMLLMPLTRLERV